MSIYDRIDKDCQKITKVTKAWILKVPAPAMPQAFSHVQAHVSSQHLLLQKIMKKNMVLISYLQKPAFYNI